MLAPSYDYESEDEGGSGVDMQDMDMVLETLMQHLKPGGTLYILGRVVRPLDDDELDGPGVVYWGILNLLDSVKSVSCRFEVGTLVSFQSLLGLSVDSTCFSALGRISKA